MSHKEAIEKASESSQYTAKVKWHNLKVTSKKGKNDFQREDKNHLNKNKGIICYALQPILSLLSLLRCYFNYKFLGVIKGVNHITS